MNMRRCIVTTLMIFALSVVFTPQVTAEAMKPNIVFIMVDDLGPGWVDFDGSSPEINTPHLMAQNPELAERLRNKLNRWLKKVSAEMSKNAAYSKGQ